MKYLSSLLAFTVLFFGISNVLIAGGGVTADFTADKTTVTVGETAMFTDNSTQVGCGGINSWIWDFGTDATPANASVQGPHNVTYSSPGTKTIMLTANTPATCNDSTSMMIMVTALVPTLSEWGLILLAILLLSFGTVKVAREQLVLAAAGNVNLPFSKSSLPFSNAHFSKAVGFTAILALVGFTASIFLTGTIAASDLIGVFMTAPAFAYLTHLLLILEEKK